MKILIFSSYIYNPLWPEFSKNKTGYGMILNDIIHSIGKHEEVYATSYVITSGRGNKILSHTYSDVVKNVCIHDVFAGIRAFFLYNLSFGNRLKHVYYYINKGYVRSIIKRINPDVVHVHGIGTGIIPVLEACNEMHVSYIVSLHGMIKDDDEATIYDKEVEKRFIRDSYTHHLPITVVSTGVKQRMEDAYLGHSADNIFVVLNGTDSDSIASSDSFQDIVHIDDPGVRIITVLGSLCERKNQIQIVRAFASNIVKYRCKVLLCGIDGLNGEIQNAIEKEGLQDIIFVMGFLTRDKISAILEHSDLNLVASLDEGFGLSIIESFSHGVPTVAFSDLDAISDLFDDKAMVLVEERSDIALAKGIVEALSRNWDRGWIKKYAKNFSIDQMAISYISLYKMML